jgi:hypothetical protein
MFGQLLGHFIFSILFSNKEANIIFILTDDQRWDALRFAGNSIIETPEMDALARSGTYFRNAFQPHRFVRQAGHPF